MKIPSLLACLAISLISACSDNSLKAPEPPAFVQETPSNWALHQQQEIQLKADYIREHQAAYDWFADFAFSEKDGVPYILFRLLPVIAPELWGDDDNFLEVVGLYNDERQIGYPMPRGIGFSAFAREEPLANIDFVSFTCAACHFGRVRTEQGDFSHIDGGVNTEFNLVLYRVKVFQTLEKIFGSEEDADRRNELLVTAFSQALDQAQALRPDFFYRNYRNESVTFDASYEAAQIDKFKANAAHYIGKFSTKAVDEYTGYAALLNKNYESILESSLEGFPGMADATGVSSVNAYNGLRKGPLTRWIASSVLPGSPGMTDFMSVWEQENREAEWDSEHERLINGSGQWNGSIPIPIYRNLAAQLTLGLEDNDIRVSAFGVELLDGLPASVYPFDVDIELAKKGERLFADNCAQCHQPHNGKVYSNLNVNLDRSFVVNWLLRRGGVDSFYKACTPETTVIMTGNSVKPCAEFRGVPLEGKEQLIMSPNDEHHGYNARPLNGIWAQAPYLHNGSVPTMYHLLVPNERPPAFIKSRLEYDQQYLGFSWLRAPASNTLATEGYLFDTTSFSAFSNSGHDTDIIENGKTYKLDWSDDIDGVWALIEYLKTM